MRVILDICVYCERKAAEIVADGDAEDEDTALAYVKILDNQVLLCPVCIEAHTKDVEQPFELPPNGPVTFPPGIRSIEHTCPVLEENGEAPQWATYTLQMRLSGDYYIATCDHCGITVRSLDTPAL